MPADPHSQVPAVSAHHRLATYFCPFQPGAGAASRGWAHRAPPQPLPLASALATRQQRARLSSPRGKRRRCACACRVQGQARSSHSANPAPVAGLSINQRWLIRARSWAPAGLAASGACPRHVRGSAGCRPLHPLVGWSQPGGTRPRSRRPERGERSAGGRCWRPREPGDDGSREMGGGSGASPRHRAPGAPSRPCCSGAAARRRCRRSRPAAGPWRPPPALRRARLGSARLGTAAAPASPPAHG